MIIPSKPLLEIGIPEARGWSKPPCHESIHLRFAPYIAISKVTSLIFEIFSYH
jgi:hypothetical protein